MPENNKNFLQENGNTIFFLIVTIACLLVFGQLINADFINIDDHAYVYKNPHTLSGVNWDSVRWAFTSFEAANWHPLTWISHALDVQMFGTKPGFHHATNIIFHIINSILAFVVFRKFTGDFWKSAAVAFLFAIHPAHVESVAWISERKDVLSTMFWLLTMWVYLRYVEEKRTGGKQSETKSFFSSPPFLLFSISLLFALGLMAKPMLVTLPFVLLLMDFWTLERLKNLRDLPPLVIEKLPLFAIALASSIVTVIAQKGSGATQMLEFIPLTTRLVNTFPAYVKYVGMLFYPVNLGVWYPYNTQIILWQFVGAILLLIAITAFCVWQRNERKYLLMGWLWFLGTLVPVIGLVQVGGQGMADRYTYIPFFGLFIMLVWGANDVFERFGINQKIAAAACLIALLIFGTLTYKQVSYWQNNETLYTHTLAVTQNNYFIMNNLCLHYIETVKIDVAEKQCAGLLEDTSPDPPSHNTLGLLRAELGRYDEAVKSFQKALQLKPDFNIVYSNMAATQAKQGNLAEAEKNMQIVLTMNDETLSRAALAYSCNVLGLGFVKNNQIEKAAQYFEKALELKPDFNQAKANLKKIRGEK